MFVAIVVAGAVIFGPFLPSWGRRRSSRGLPRSSDIRSAADATELRRSVIDRAAAIGARLPVSRSGHNPMTVTYSVGHPVFFYTSLDAYRRDTDARSVDPDYASWGRSAPLTVSEWSAEECRDWLTENP